MIAIATNTRKKKSAPTALLFFLIFLLLLALGAFLILQRLQSPARIAVGTWRMRAELAEPAARNAQRWLYNAELGDRVDLSEAFHGVHADVLLTLRRDGSWERSLDMDSYAAARIAAQEAMAASARSLLRLRIAALGRGGGTDEYAELLFRDTLGMSSADYFASYGPELLPAPEELQSRYGGAGAWRIADGRLLLSDEAEAMDVLVNDRLLVLSGPEGTEVYTRDALS